MNRLERAKEIQSAIEDLLQREWDPLGMRDEPGCEHEYRSYVGGVYRLLASRATVEELAEHLARLERERMGLEPATATSCLAVARRLHMLDVSLGAAADKE